jgi:hypothetical protein
MNPAAPEGAPPQRISAGKHVGKHRNGPPCLGEALRREAIMPRFIDFHGLSVNTLFMSVSTEPQKPQVIHLVCLSLCLMCVSPKPKHQFFFRVRLHIFIASKE